MSYQPGYPDPGQLRPPPQVPTQAMPTTPAQVPAAASSGGRRPTFWLGLGLIAASLIGAVVWWIGGRAAHETSVKALARVAPNLTTQLNFSGTGRYTMYYESAGTMTVLTNGDEESRTIEGSEQPVRLREVKLLDPDGAEIEVARRAGDVSYDTGGHRGVSMRSFEIATAGDGYTLTVTPRNADDDSFAVAIGQGTLKEPGMAGPLLLALLGTGLGALLMALGRKRTTIEVTAPAWSPGTGAPGPVWSSGPPPVATGSVPADPAGWGSSGTPSWMPPQGPPASAWGAPSTVNAAPVSLPTPLEPVTWPSQTSASDVSWSSPPLVASSDDVPPPP